MKRPRVTATHDFSGDARTLDAVADAMSYLLGRNLLDQSYVTGTARARSSTRTTASGRTARNPR